MATQKPDIRIETVSRGETYYHPDKVTVYQYDTYPESSVNHGMTRRRWLDQFDTVEEAQAKYPEAEVVTGSGYVKQSFNHLPDAEGELAEDSHGYDPRYDE